MHTLIVQGRPLPDGSGGASGGGPRTYGAGRRCVADGCATILSTYNPSALCALHANGWSERPIREPRHHDARPVQTRRCANVLCAAEFTTSNPSRTYCSDRCRMKAFQLRVAQARRQTAA